MTEWKALASIAGVKLGVACAGIKYQDREDTAVVLIDEGARVAGVFTQNSFAAAPIDVCRSHLNAGPHIRALIINSGNANACTGAAGFTAAMQSCEHLAEKMDVLPTQVLPFSTGVIGEPLPIEKIIAVIPKACDGAHHENWLPFAQAIMTTDTRPKGASKIIEWQGEKIHISGVSKGAGMMNPNMATMLAFVATDADIEAVTLDKLSRLAAQKTFNRITIDGDTSTNDACMLIASGKSAAPAISSEDDKGFSIMLDALVEVYESLATQIVRDGEGATKFVVVDVDGGSTADESLSVAYAIAHSPLVKTAMFASDPNWGRIVMAIGNADIEAFDSNKVSVWIDDLMIVDNGGKASGYTEEKGKRVFSQAEFTIRVALGRGEVREKIWTSDLSHEYVRINAEYRT